MVLDSASRKSKPKGEGRGDLPFFFKMNLAAEQMVLAAAYRAVTGAPLRSAEVTHDQHSHRPVAHLRLGGRVAQLHPCRHGAGHVAAGGQRPNPAPAGAARRRTV